MILKRDLIPMQDDTENGGGLTGERRPNARRYAERRDIESRSDQPVFGTGRQHRICQTGRSDGGGQGGGIASLLPMSALPCRPIPRRCRTGYRKRRVLSG